MERRKRNVELLDNEMQSRESLAGSAALAVTGISFLDRRWRDGAHRATFRRREPFEASISRNRCAFDPAKLKGRVGKLLAFPSRE